MDRTEIKHLLGTTIYKRALSYYRDGRVIASYSDEGTIDAVVKGSGDNRYRVRIIFNERGSLREATCNCPYPYYCKHIGAVLLKFLEDREIYPVIKSRDFNLPAEGGIAKKREDEIVFLEDSGEGIDKGFFDGLSSSIAHYGLKSDVGSGQRFKLVFVMEEKYSSLRYSDSSSGWVLKPYLRYIKKDGTPGRFESFNPERLGFPVAGLERELLSILTSGEEDRLIDYYIEMFLPVDTNDSDKVGYKQVDLYLKDAKGYKPVEFKRIERTVITFSFVSLRLEANRKVPYFEPIFDFYDENGGVTSIRPYLKVSSLSRCFFLVEKKSARIFYLLPSPDTVMYRDLMSALLRKTMKYSYSMITSLKEFISSQPENFSQFVDVYFPIKRIRLRYISPQPVLDLKSRFMDLELRLLFKYGDRVVEYSDEAELLIIGRENEELIVAVRGKEYEKRWMYFLSDYLSSNISGVKSTGFLGKFKDSLPSFGGKKQGIEFTISGSIEEFLVKHGERLLEEGFELRKRGRKIDSVSGIHLFVQGEIDWLDIKIKLNTENNEEIEINPAEDSIEGLFLKKGDSYYLLRREDIEKLKRLFSHGKPDRDVIKIPVTNLAVIDELYEDFVNREDEILLKLKTVIEGLKNFRRNFREIESLSPSPEFKGALRAYQKEGLSWLYFLYRYGVNGILADDMGLGKTVQVLALFSVLKEKNELGNVLIVTPVSTLSNWAEEIKRFTPNLTYHIHYGQKRLREVESIENSDITLISYQTLRNDINVLKGFPFGYLVMDEAQIAKNPTSKVYRALKLVNATHKLALTGTPVENTTVDLWAQMSILNPGLLGSLSDFKEKFTKPIERDGDKEKSELLRKMVSFFILRREKENVLKELPPKEESILYATMDTRQRELYEQLKSFYREKIINKLEHDGLNKSSAVIFEALLRLRQVAILPALVSDKYSSVPACKVDLLKLKIEEILSSKRKLLVFSQFKGSLSVIKNWLDSIGVKYSYLDGSTKNREEEIRAFQEERERKVFIISLKAGGLGINLTAADYVIIFDPWWNPAVEMQAVDRSHRIGQVNKVIIYKLITKDTIEEKILRLQEKKSSLVRDIVTTESSFFKSLNEDEILALFENSF